MVDEFTLILWQSAPSDYQECNWQQIYSIKSERDYYEALKDGYLTDASTRNDFPIVSFDVGRIYTFDNLSQYDHTGSIQHRDLRSYNTDYELKSQANKEYQNAIVKFKRWKQKIQTLIPRIRNIAREKERETNEIKRLFELAKKYGYDLHKVL